MSRLTPPDGERPARFPIEQAPAILWTVDRDLRFTYGFGSPLQALGLTANELRGRTLAEYFGEDTADVTPIAAHRLALAGESSQFEFVWTGRTYQCAVAPLRDAGGAIAGCIGTALDVSDAARHTAVLREAKLFNEEIINNAGEGVAVYDRNLRHVVFNRFLEELTGLAGAEVLGRPVSEVFPELREEPGASCVARALAGEAVRLPELEFHVPRTARAGWLAATLAPHRDAAGDIVGVIAIISDMTARKTAEAVIQSRNRLEETVARLSARFINLPHDDFDEAMNDALARIGTLAQADASYVFLFPEDRREAVLAHVWTAPGSPPPPEVATGRSPALATENFAWAAERLSRGEALHVARVEDLPPEARPLRRLCEQSGVRSFLVVPLSSRGNAIGVLGFASLRGPHRWEPEYITLLQLVADILAGAFQRRRAEQAIEGSERLYRLLFERSLAGAFRCSPEGRILECNEACARLLGYASRDALVGADATSLYADPEEHDRIAARLAGEGSIANHEVELRRGDGSARWGLASLSLVELRPGERSIFGTLIDITQRKVTEESLAFRASHDELTGLPKRTLFQEHLRQAIARAQRRKEGLAVLFLDLDNFKQINDRFGHELGDGILREAASRIRSCVRADDTVARFGGDEFTLILPEVGREEDLVRIARKILERVAEPFPAAGELIRATTSIGASLYPLHGRDAETLVRRADEAMYTAKRLGRNWFQLASPIPD